jgi:hypothetical protein
MNTKLSRIVEEIKSRNPGPGIDAGKLLQTAIVAEGEGFSEDDLFRALDALGVPEEDQIGWFEDLASYI